MRQKAKSEIPDVFTNMAENTDAAIVQIPGVVKFHIRKDCQKFP